MNLKMSEKSLFAVLLRKPWWVSVAIAAVLALLALALLPQAYKAVGALSFTLPWLIIAGMVAWRQRHAPSAASVARSAQALAGMPWAQFADLLEQAFRRDGHRVQRRSGAADFDVDRRDRRLLVSARRWKTAHTGVEPLRLLQAERDKVEAADAVYVSLGDLSEAARSFAQENGITIWQVDELAQVLGALIPTKAPQP